MAALKLTSIALHCCDLNPSGTCAYHTCFSAALEPVHLHIVLVQQCVVPHFMTIIHDTKTPNVMYLCKQVWELPLQCPPLPSWLLSQHASSWGQPFAPQWLTEDTHHLVPDRTVTASPDHTPASASNGPWQGSSSTHSAHEGKAEMGQQDIKQLLQALPEHQPQSVCYPSHGRIRPLCVRVAS
jgi:hypothetical protein